ncbi:MAG: hypothetical protein FIB00_05155 [Chloroflexi bacterium]|nr:hypothetical protein [Chloroflexota bacterium]
MLNNCHAGEHVECIVGTEEGQLCHNGLRTIRGEFPHLTEHLHAEIDIPIPVKCNALRELSQRSIELPDQLQFHGMVSFGVLCVPRLTEGKS